MKRYRKNRRKTVRFSSNTKAYDGLYITKYFAKQIMDAYMKNNNSIYSISLYEKIPNNYDDYTDIRYKLFLYFLHLKKQIEIYSEVRLFSSSNVVFYSDKIINTILQNLVLLLRTKFRTGLSK